MSERGRAALLSLQERSSTTELSPLLPNVGSLGQQRDRQGHSSSAFPLEGQREDSKAGRAGRARPCCTTLSPRERLWLLPPSFHSSSSAAGSLRMDGMQLSLLTADQELLFTGDCIWWWNALLASQPFRNAEVTVTSFRVNSSTATLPVSIKCYLRQKIIQNQSKPWSPLQTQLPEYLELDPAFTGSSRKLQEAGSTLFNSVELKWHWAEPQAAHRISVYLNPPFHTDTSSALHSFPWEFKSNPWARSSSTKHSHLQLLKS